MSRMEWFLNRAVSAFLVLVMAVSFVMPFVAAVGGEGHVHGPECYGAVVDVDEPALVVGPVCDLVEGAGWLAGGLGSGRWFGVAVGCWVVTVVAGLGFRYLRGRRERAWRSR